ncbi:MAG: enoyl-CoA hydratase-related protein [Myxococcota bacterium]
MTSPLTVSREGNLARIQMDDGRGNALSTTMLQELGRAAREVVDADAVLLSGRPRVFCGGLDLAEVVPMPRQALLEFMYLFHDTFRALLALERPLVIQAAGSAVAGGAVLLCCGDLRLGAQDSGVVGANEAQLGIPFPVTAFEAVRAALDPLQASRALLFGELVDKGEALARGYFHELVAPTDLEETALARARQAALIPSSASAPIKRDLRRETLRRVDEQRVTSTEAWVDVWIAPTAQARLQKVLAGLKKK